MTDTTTMIDTIDSYNRHMRAAGLSENTIKSRETTAMNLNTVLKRKYNVDLSSGNVGKIKGYMLDNWYQGLDVSPASKNLYVTNIKGLFAYIVQAGYMKKDPSEILKKVRIIKDDDEYDEENRRAYTVDDVVALIKVRMPKSVDKRDRAMVAMLLAGGFRASELCSLNVGDYRNMRNGRIYTKRKGGAMKWVYVADYANEYVDEYLAERPDATDDEPLFTTNRGTRMDRVLLYQRMKRRQKELELETGVHIMRHTFLTEVDRRNQRGLTQALGAHSDSKTTQIYVNPTTDELRGAANSVAWGRKLFENEGDED